MAGLFSKKSRKGKVQFVDLEGQTLKEGDRVMSLRYDLGECRIVSRRNRVWHMNPWQTDNRCSTSK